MPSKCHDPPTENLPFDIPVVHQAQPSGSAHTPSLVPCRHNTGHQHQVACWHQQDHHLVRATTGNSHNPYQHHNDHILTNSHLTSFKPRTAGIVATQESPTIMCIKFYHCTNRFWSTTNYGRSASAAVWFQLRSPSPTTSTPAECVTSRVECPNLGDLAGSLIKRKEEKEKD